MSNSKVWLPLAIAVAVAGAVYLGVRIGESRSVYAPYASAGNNADDVMTSTAAASKLTYMFDLLNDRYVDTLNLHQLVEDAIPTIIEELDPHSVYIPAEDLQSVNDELEGSFSGVGIQFNIQQDTVMVIQVIAGGPSERVGLMAGDRIVSVDDSTFVGPGINNDRVLKTLRGAKGSQVKLGVRRATSDEVLYYDVTRGDIPVQSVVAQYNLSAGTTSIGYIKIDNFGRNTYNEFFTALVQLKSRGVRAWLIDLRGNGGGYMEVCCQMVNEFLKRGDMIVYTEGQSVPRNEVRADGRGNFQNDPITVIIDEWSASASEIFAGAIQDNDRGTIVGRRSFGKGLVQQQFDLNDGSALRLTIARYHTPSGRCIQKPYAMGDGEDYAMDLANRYEHGEFYSADSIHLADSLEYTTVGGRTVYGGGGIMPDHFEPSDTSYVSAYYNRCVNLGLCYSFAFQYCDAHRDQLAALTDYDAMSRHLHSLGLLGQFEQFASSRVKPRPGEMQRSGSAIERLICAYIMRQAGNENFFYRELNSGDKTYNAALHALTTALRSED